MLSDCYIFPVPPASRRDSIEHPLSVMEAMACNLPIITTRFGALPRIFENGDGLFFAEKEEDFFDALEEIKNKTIEIKTRDMILPYSWENVIKKLYKIYSDLLEI